MYKAEELAKFIVKTKFEDLPGDVVNKAKECAIDSVGCAIGATPTEIGRMLIDVAEAIGGKPESTLLGSPEKVSVAVAAFANSELANKLDYDDVSPGHAGATVVPPAIAMAEKVGSTGKDIINAIVLGYEMSCRVVASVRERWPAQQKTALGLGTWQTFGAAVVAGKLLNLNDEQMTNTIAIAGTNAPVPSLLKTWGATYPWDVIPRTFHVKNNYGTASWVGVTSAMLAQKGYNGPPDLFEGELGFWRWMGGIGYDNTKLTAGFGERWGIMGVNFKKYLCCGIIHPAVAGTLEIIGKNNIRAEDISEITVKTLEVGALPMFTNLDIKDMQDLLFSLPWSLAAEVVGIGRTPNYYNDCMANPRVKYLAERTHVIADVEADAIMVMPPKEPGLVPPMRATIDLVAKGKTFTNQYDMYWGPGYTNNPDAKQKFTALVSPIIGTEKTSKLFEGLQELEKLANIRELTKLAV